MSTCISFHGEYSEHVLDGDYICTRCNVLDEDALIAERDRLRAAVDAALALLAELDAWTPYNSRDTGETFLAESVRDLVADLRRALADPGPQRPDTDTRETQ